MNQHFERYGTKGIIITDKPDGGNKGEKQFLDRCLETLLNGTKYVDFTNILQNVLTTHSHFSRLLQVADVVTSCTLARIAGEETHSPRVFDLINDIFDSNGGKIGGYGVKIHPKKYKYLYDELLRNNSPFLPDYPDDL